MWGSLRVTFIPRTATGWMMPKASVASGLDVNGVPSQTIWPQQRRTLDHLQTSPTAAFSQGRYDFSVSQGS
jgi:hypothetical protein